MENDGGDADKMEALDNFMSGRGMLRTERSNNRMVSAIIGK